MKILGLTHCRLCGQNQYEMRKYHFDRTAVIYDLMLDAVSVKTSDPAVSITSGYRPIIRYQGTFFAVFTCRTPLAVKTPH